MYNHNRRTSLKLVFLGEVKQGQALAVICFDKSYSNVGRLSARIRARRVQGRLGEKTLTSFMGEVDECMIGSECVQAVVRSETHTPRRFE